MSLKQNFEWFRNSDSFLIQELIGWVGFRNGFSFFAMGFVAYLGFGFSDADKTIHVSSLRNHIYPH